MTIEEIMQQCPEVKEIMRQAKIRGKNKQRSNRWLDYMKYKGELLNLVGYGSKYPGLDTERAYHVAMMALLDALEL